MYMKKNTVKLVTLVMVLALILGCAIGGTLAWLVTNTGPVVNTFTVGNINIELTETFTDKSSNDKSGNDIWKGKMVPGTDLAKDPKVTVKANSEDCWLFVKIEEAGTVTVDNKTYTFGDFIEYAVGSTWETVDVAGESYKLYAMKVTASAANQDFYVLKGIGDGELKNGYVTIKSTVTKDMMDNVTDANAPKLTFTAYAIQSDNLTKDGKPVESAADAWAVYTNPPQQPTN